MPKPQDISASRGAAILGLSQYSTPVEIWLDIMESRNHGFCIKNGYTPPEPPVNDMIKWGIAFEDAVIKRASVKKRDKIISREKFIQNDFMTAHLDGIYKKSGLIHEGKTTNSYYYRENFGDAGSDRIPKIYQVQVQHQMMLTNIDRCILSVLVFPKRQTEFDIDVDKISTETWARTLDQMGYFHQYEIKADKELQALMIDHYSRWWHRFVLQEEEPPAETYKDFASLINDPSGTILADEQVCRWHSEYKQINAETADLKKQKDQLKIQILTFMKKQDQTIDKIIDDDSEKKWILRDQAGKKLFQYDGKTLR